MAEERDGVIVKPVGLVAIVVTLGGVGLGVQGGLAGEGVGAQARVDEMRTPGSGVAGHEKEGEEIVVIR